MKKQPNTVLPEFNRLCARRKKRRGGKGRGRKKPFSSKVNISKYQFDLERTDTFKRFFKNS